MPETVGFIGLGIMGRPTALNLVRAGFLLVVHSRSPGPVDELVAAGATRGDSPTEVASAAPVVITMLPVTPDVEEAVFGARGVAEGARVPMLDAPESGGERGAIDGTCRSWWAARRRNSSAPPVLATLGKSVVHVGPSGAGQVGKACN